MYVHVLNTADFYRASLCKLSSAAYVEIQQFCLAVHHTYVVFNIRWFLRCVNANILLLDVKYCDKIQQQQPW